MSDDPTYQILGSKSLKHRYKISTRIIDVITQKPNKTMFDLTLVQQIIINVMILMYHVHKLYEFHIIIA